MTASTAPSSDLTRPVGDSSLADVFRATAEAYPNRPCIVQGDLTRTYSEVRDRVERLACVLEAHGLGLHAEREALTPWESGQDHIGLYLLNGPEYMEASLASYAARAVPFNVNYRYVAEELAYLLSDASAAAIVYHACFGPTLEKVLGRLDRAPLLFYVADDSDTPPLADSIDFETAIAGAPAARCGANTSPDDLYMLYTGGTTGMPKGTLWRQADLWWAALGGHAYPSDATLADVVAANATRVSRSMPIPPLMHGGGHWMALSSLLLGHTIVLQEVTDRLDPCDIWQTVIRHDVDTALIIGEAFARPLLDDLEQHGHAPTTLRRLLTGGAAMTATTKRRLVEAIPRLSVHDVAGSSETGSVLTQVHRSDTGQSGANTNALFIPSSRTVVINDDKDALVPREPGADGWLASADHVPLGYLGDRAKSEQTFVTVEGRRFALSGDRVRWSDDGRIELLGRDSVTINTGGEKVFAEEVEQAMLAHPAVSDVIVVGRPSERWGQEIVALVSLRDVSASAEDLLEMAAEHVARYKLPKEIRRVDSVVRGPAGKADYTWARAVATAAPGPDATHEVLR